MLEPDEARIVSIVTGFCARNGYSPSVREIQIEAAQSSSSVTHKLLVRLRDKGVIAWQPGCFRTLRVNPET